MGKKKTHEEYVLELAEKNPKIEVLESYIDSNTKILHRCKLCGNEWPLKPGHALAGVACRKCAGTQRGTQRLKTKKME